MELGKVGLWSMDLRNAVRPEVRDTAAELEEIGWTTLWLPGLDGSGALDDVDHLLAVAKNSRVVTGVLNIWGQTPAELAEAVAGFDYTYGERAVIGLGIGSPAGAAARGLDYGSPVASMSRYLDELQLPPARLLLGALGPRMVELAVGRTAGWHPFLVTPGYVDAYRQRVGAGPWIAPHQAVVLESDPVKARTVARNEIGMFLGFPTYRTNLTRLGFTDDDLTHGGSDRLIDALVAHGSADDIAGRVREHLDAGADHVAVHVLGANKLVQWRELAFLARPDGIPQSR